MGLRNWLGMRSGGPHPSSVPRDGASGIYKIHGDYRPKLGELATLRAAVLAFSSDDPGRVAKVREFNRVLSEVLKMLIKPLDREYELQDSEMDSDYVEFKKHWITGGPHTIGKLLSRPGGEQVALVRVLSEASPSTMEVRVTPLEIYRGSFSSNQTISVCRVSGFNEKWFIKGEECLVFCDNSFLSCGPLGRMPKVQIDGLEWIESYIYPEFWGDFLSVRFISGVSLVKWSEVRQRLLVLR